MPMQELLNIMIISREIQKLDNSAQFGERLYNMLVTEKSVNSVKSDVFHLVPFLLVHLLHLKVLMSHIINFPLECFSLVKDFLSNQSGFSRMR